MKGRCRYHIKIRWAFIALGVMWLILVLCLSVIKRNRENVSQHIAEQYAKGMTQISIFLEEQAQASQWNVRSILSHIYEQSQSEQTLISKPLLKYCYSASREVMVSRRKQNAEVALYGVGGDFFAFHPFPLSCGKYLEEIEPNAETGTGRVVITTQTAFRLCGSKDVVGLQLLMHGKPFIIQGVIEVADVRVQMGMDEEEQSQLLQAYISSTDFKQLFAENEPFLITTIEILLPNPVKNYGASLVQQCVQEELGTDREFTVVENTGRFSFLSLINMSKNVESYIVRDNAIKYPFWENVARVQELESVFNLLAAFILFLLMLICSLRCCSKK